MFRTAATTGISHVDQIADSKARDEPK
jgi:hypothetical protein